jgi:hypothetical protein
MAYRRFTDRSGVTWEVQDRSTSEWELHPVSDTRRSPVRVAAPGYERDPFELSVEELQRLLDGAPRPGSGPRKSPFKD